RVVGDAELLDLVGFRADVVASHPGSGLSFQPPVSQVQARIDQPVIRLRLRLKFLPRAATIERLVGHLLRHLSALPPCPINVQYTGVDGGVQRFTRNADFADIYWTS